MSVLMVRAAIKPESVAELEAATEKWFAAVEQAQPGGVKYATCKLADGVTFVVLLAVEDDDADNPLGAVPGFQEFQQKLGSCVAEPPSPEQLTVVGSYRLF